MSTTPTINDLRVKLERARSARAESALSLVDQEVIDGFILAAVAAVVDYLAALESPKPPAARTNS